MFRKFILAAVIAAFGAACTSSVDAAFITSNATVNLANIDFGPPVTFPSPLLGIKQIDGAGLAFTNQVSGLPFATGGEIRTITVNTNTQALNGTNVPIVLPNGRVAVFITALLGEIVSGGLGGIVTAEFTVGRTFLTYADAGFQLGDPTTWNFAGVFAEYELVSNSLVNGAPVGAAVPNVPQSLMNESDVNTAVSVESQGRFLFLEDSTDVQNAGATPGLGAGTGGDNFFTVANNAPGGQLKGREGFYSEVAQRVEFSSYDDIPLPAGSLAALNAIAQAAGFSDLDGNGSYWATGLGAGPQTHWNPQFPGAPTPGVPTGDFRAVLGIKSYPGHEVVPEPSSIVLFGLAMLSSLFFVTRRGDRTATAAV